MELKLAITGLQKMQTIDAKTWINAPLSLVYEIAKDIQSFPNFMPELKSIHLISSENGKVVSEWVGIVPSVGLKVRWMQEDLWDDRTHTCTFRQLQGYYDQMEGLWRLSEENGRTLFESTLHYEYVVPGLGPLIKKVIFNLVSKNVESILQAIKQKSESVHGETIRSVPT